MQAWRVGLVRPGMCLREVMRRTLKISVDLLPVEIRGVFEAMFDICRTRSVTAWEVAQVEHADLVCCVPAHAEQPLGLRRNQMKLWFADRHQVTDLMSDGDLSISPLNMRVATVLGAIDMAALRLMDSSIYTHLNGPTSVTVQPVTREASAPAHQPVARYTLTHWPVLTGKFSERAYLNAAGMMAKRAVTIDAVCRFTGLRVDEVSALINELSRLRALKTVTAVAGGDGPQAQAEQRAASPSNARRAEPPKNGFLGRIRAWLASSPA